MHNAYIGIGTNIEPRSVRITQSILALQNFGTIEKKSSVYETAPFGFTEQENFLNAVALLRTELSLDELHKQLQNLEKQLGRTKRQRWHEREIDFDILFFDSVIVNSETLTVPHSELQNRAFVLVPLAEIAPDVMHPVFRKTVSALLNELKYDKESIHQWH